MRGRCFGLMPMSQTELSRLLKVPFGVARGLMRYMRVVDHLARGLVVDVPVDRITTEFAFGYGSTGWNYHRAMLVEAMACSREIPSWRLFFHRLAELGVRNLNDVMTLGSSEAGVIDAQFWFGTWPWGHWWKRHLPYGSAWGWRYDQVSGSDTSAMYGKNGNPWHRPGDLESLSKEERLTLALSESIRTRGYRPLLHGSFPEAVLLIRSDGEFVAVRSNGQHRLAVLSATGHQRVRMMIARESVGVLREEDVESWPYVQAGACSPDDAHTVFNWYFRLSGRERARSLGIPLVY